MLETRRYGAANTRRRGFRFRVNRGHPLAPGKTRPPRGRTAVSQTGDYRDAQVGVRLDDAILLAAVALIEQAATNVAALAHDTDTGAAPGVQHE